MNNLIRPIEVMHLLRHGASPLPNVIVLGMPHLSLAGLSETWLLKECGHRHWFQLAAAAGLARPDFRDEVGEPIYAAFLGVSVRDATLDTVREHDELVIASQLVRTSRTQFTSIHRLSIRARPLAEVVMTSTFVKRAQKGRNHSIARVEVPSLAPLEPEPRATSFATDAAAISVSSEARRRLLIVLSSIPVPDWISTAPIFCISPAFRPLLIVPNGHSSVRPPRFRPHAGATSSIEAISTRANAWSRACSRFGRRRWSSATGTAWSGRRTILPSPISLRTGGCELASAEADNGSGK